MLRRRLILALVVCVLGGGVLIAQTPSQRIDTIIQQLEQLRGVIVVPPPPPPPPPPAQNLAPVVNAGPDQAVTLPALMTLSGTVTDDGRPPGASVTRVWTRTSGPGTVAFTATTAAFSAAGSYVLRLTGNDSLLTAFDELTVTVSPVGVPPPPPPPPPPPSGSKTLVDPATFTLLGYYDLLPIVSPYEHGLTYRMVGGDLRFLVFNYPAAITEFSIAGKAFGSAITATTNSWTNVPCMVTYKSLSWDEAGQRLWTTSGSDYTVQFIQTQICTHTLPAAGGAVTNTHGPLGLSGISAKRVFGGMTILPDWWRTQTGITQKYLVGWGGYTSLVAQGGGASMGFTAYAVPDPASVANGAILPTGGFRILADHATGASGDWYASGQPINYDRGVRLTGGMNYFDRGDPRSNPSTPPTIPPVAGAQWLSPAPDGKARFWWSDTYGSGAQFIDLPAQYGLVAVAGLCGGKGYYMSSTLWCDERVWEFHVFDPADLARVAAGTLKPWQVQPAKMVRLTLPGFGGKRGSDYNQPGHLVYVKEQNRLYLLVSTQGYAPPSAVRLFVFQL